MNKETSEKNLSIFETVVAIIVIIILIFTKAIPENKSNKGSSDKYVNIENINTIIEVNLSTRPDFIITTDSDKVINSIVFLNEESTCLYNKNIENKQLKNGIKIIVDELSKEGYLEENTIVKFVQYEKNNDYNEIKSEFNNQINSYKIQTIEELSTLTELCQKYNINSYANIESQIEALELYSKTICNTKKNNHIIENFKTISNSEAKIYADKIYTKLVSYATTTANQNINDSSLPIQLIPASSEIEIYPSSESWYYIENHKVYAYINFKSDNYNYSFCYKGDIENVKEGIC